MTKKQKKMLIRICIAIVLLLIAKFVPMPGGCVKPIRLTDGQETDKKGPAH